MQKKLIALAVAGLVAAPVFAQSNVTIGGWMTINAKYYKASSLNQNARGAVQKFKAEYRVDDDSNSRIWFTGKEDLGGGWDAHFYMESRFGADNGSGATTFGLAAGDTFVGLTTPVGTFDFGRVTTYYTQGILIDLDKSLSGGNQPTLTAMSTMGTMLVNGYSRNNNNIRYVSPRVGGFQGTVVVSPNFGGDEGKIPTAGLAANNKYPDGRSFMLAANYMNGPIYLNAAYWDAKIEGRPTGVNGAASMLLADQKAWRVGGSYTFPFGLKIGLGYDKFTVKNVAAGVGMPAVFFAGPAAGVNGGGAVRTKGSVSRGAWMLPISYAWGGKHTAFFKYAQAGDLSNWAKPVNESGGTGAKFYVMGYDYALSRRTVVGVSYSITKNDGNGIYQPFAAGSTHTGSGLLAGEKAASLQLNLAHRF